MGHKLENVLALIAGGGVVIDDCVVFSSVCHIVQVKQDVKVLGIVSVSYANVHIPRFIFVSPYAIHPIDFFILRYIKSCTCANVFNISAIEMQKTKGETLCDRIVGLLGNIKRLRTEQWVVMK